MISFRSLRCHHSVELDTQARTVTVGGGIKYGELATQLHENGWALPNLASLPHISVAGACATATHGSGAGNGNLATAVQAMELVTASGELIDISRDDDPELVDALAVGLGAFGIVTRLTLSVEPTFDVAQRVLRAPADGDRDRSARRDHAAPGTA